MADAKYLPRLRRDYDERIVPAMIEKFGYKNRMEVPRLEKIVINMGVGKATQQPSLLEGAVRDMTVIAGQKPIVTKAKDSIAGFKLREGQDVGAKVTLRGQRMEDFFYRLIHIVLPRVRDFRGLSPKSFDGQGNYSLGLTEHTVFPEIAPEDSSRVHPLEITIVTTGDSDDESRELLKRLGVPFAGQEEQK